MWYVLKCRSGQEETILRSCRQHLSAAAMDDVFLFRSERLWRKGGAWRRVELDLFPGYVFLESRRPDLLSEELERYRGFLTVLEEPDYLISVYEEEEAMLRRLCGEQHVLRLSYGYRKDGVDHITKGPLKGMASHIQTVDWHRRFARLDISLSRRQARIWAGVGLDMQEIAAG